MYEEGVLGGRYAPPWIVPTLLLFLREEDCRGHELTRRIGDSGFGEVHPRVVNEELRWMEREDLIASERDGFDYGPTRRWYSITAPGVSYLETWADSLARHQEELDLFFALYEGSARECTAERAVEGRTPRTSRMPVG